MNFRYKLMQFMSGRYGIDKMFYVLFSIAAILAIINTFLRLIVLQIIVYLIVLYAFFRILSKNISARQKENRAVTVVINTVNKKIRTYKQQKADLTHIYKKCPKCKAVLRLPRRKGKHTTVCPKCQNKMTVRVFKEYKF